MPLSLITPPTIEPLSWLQVQKQTRQEGVEDDADYVTSVIVPAVRDRAESSTRRALLPQTWALILSGFPAATYVEIPKPPLISITSVVYLDTGGVSRTMVPGTDYLVQAPAGPRAARGRIALPFSSVWPVTLSQQGAVTITFQCGYAGTANDPRGGLPPLLVAGMLMDAAALYEHREPFVIDSGIVSAVDVPTAGKDIYLRFRSLPTQRVDEE